MKDLEDKCDGERLRELELLGPEERRLRRDLISIYISLKAGCSRVRFGLFSQVTSGRMRDNSLRLC